jgi:UDP-2,3-diacylglucosamine hydrolase
LTEYQSTIRAMRAIFIADAHLASSHAPNYQLLLRFLHEQEGTLDTLYIMGDLFDFWLGFPSAPCAGYEAVLDALERLVLRGCRLVYFEGNHDFHLGPVFSKRLKAEIHSGPAIEQIQGRRLYLCHGDQINRADHFYLILRFMLRTPLVTLGIRFLPPAWAEHIRSFLQARSRAGYGKKTSRWDYRQILVDFARLVQKQGCDGVISGHFHIALHECIPETAVEVLALGDWMERFTYAELLDGKLTLLTYTGAARS